MASGGSSKTRIALGAILAGVAALAIAAPAAATTIAVPATANLYGAGHAAPPADPTSCNTNPASIGTLPPSIAIEAGTSVLRFQSITGLINWGAGDPEFPPDGDSSGGQSIDSALGISGFDDGTSRVPLAGVFTGASEPADPAPPRLDTSDHAFSSVSPLLNQGFFIGDGLTGNGSGSPQQFVVPAGATRLYLGFQDGQGFSGAPACYQDNSGTLTATLPDAGGKKCKKAKKKKPKKRTTADASKKKKKKKKCKKKKRKKKKK